MSLWKYLKERKLYFILVIFILLIVDITLFLDPNLSESIDTLIYINMLSILTTIIFIIMGYSRYKRELNQFIHNIKENSNMEDNYIDIVIGGDGASRSIKIDLPPFTLVGATTRVGDLSSPLRDRFGIISKLNYYTEEELFQIIKRTSRVLNMEILDDSAKELAKRSRGTPRIANRLFKRVRDFALVDGKSVIDKEVLDKALDRLKVDKLGLDETDYNLLISIIEKFNGGPVGIDALAASIGEEANTIEDVYEPYLLQNGYLKRTSRGRMVTDKTYKYLGYEKDN